MAPSGGLPRSGWWREHWFRPKLRVLARLSPSGPSGHLPPRGRFFDTQSKRKFAGVLITEYFTQALTFVGAFSIETEYILYITVNSKTVDERAALYNFTQDQKDILHQLLSEEMRPSLLALCGGIAVADGELCWPLPGHTYISCHFGEVDAFGNAGHRGTDIPAPEGTPILAAHSGTVLVSGWNDSYGNQVLLDNGAGLSTRYAHMTQTAVTAGEAVTAGQVIGYVGSTGDSTGNHLHFEVMQNGVRMNPLELVFAQ